MPMLRLAKFALSAALSFASGGDTLTRGLERLREGLLQL